MFFPARQPDRSRPNLVLVDPDWSPPVVAPSPTPVPLPLYVAALVVALVVLAAGFGRADARMPYGTIAVCAWDGSPNRLGLPLCDGS